MSRRLSERLLGVMGLDVQSAGGEHNSGVSVFPLHLALISSWDLTAPRKALWKGQVMAVMLLEHLVGQGCGQLPAPSSPSHSCGLFTFIRQF